MGIKSLITGGYNLIITVLIPLAFSLCLLYFFWGMFKYIKDGASSEKALEEGRNIMVWGIVGLFVATSIWGIIAFIRSELGVPPTQNIQKPN